MRVASVRTLFVRFVADTDRTITGFDLVLETVGSTRDVVFSALHEANANNAPGRILSIGRMALGGAMRWRRTSFDPIRITRNTLYFLAVDIGLDPVNLGCTTHGAATDVTYFTKPFGGSVSAPKSAKILYRVNADGHQPRIRSLTPPTASTVWTTRCTNVPQGRIAILILGLSATQSNGVPLPLDLSPGMPGNILWVALDNFPAAVATGDANGHAAASFYTWPAPGFEFYAQWVVDAPGELTMSDAQKLTVR